VRRHLRSKTVGIEPGTPHSPLPHPVRYNGRCLAYPLQAFDLILFELEDSQRLLMVQLQLLPALGNLSHMLGDTQGQGQGQGQR